MRVDKLLCVFLMAISETYLFDFLLAKSLAMILIVLIFRLFLLISCEFDKDIVSTEFEKQYLFKNKLLNFAQARELCEQNGAQLVQLRSKHEIDLIDNNLVNDGFWVGAQNATRATPTYFFRWFKNRTIV